MFWTLYVVGHQSEIWSILTMTGKKKNAKKLLNVNKLCKKSSKSSAAMFWRGASQSALIHSPDAYKPSSPQAGSFQGPSRRSVTIFASDIVWQKKASNSSEANWPVWTQWRPSAGRCVHNRSSGCKGSGASGSGITDTSRFFAHSWIHWIRGFLLIKSPTHLPRASPIPCKAGTLEL